MTHSFIERISYYLPETTLDNNQLLANFPEASNTDSLQKLGIKERRIVHKNELASDIGIKAANLLFEEYGILPESIDFLIFCAQEFDYYTPTTACVIHEKLGLKKSAGAIDYNLGCSGFVYGVSIANGLIATGVATKVLLITASTLTRQLHPKDKASRYLFGDAAAATLLSSSKEEKIHQFCFGTDGEGYDYIIKKDGGARHPLTEESSVEILDKYNNITSPKYLKMDGTGIFLFALKRVPKLIEETLLKNKLTIDNIDLFIFHQANSFLLETLRKKMKISEDKFYIYLENIGNTVSSSIPIALKEAMKEGKAKKGDKIMLVAFGVGLSWGATTITL
ncbi:MAG: ketoacyl-ACP synthase III [Flavobacteriaceae bacterium]|nr:ketoacyl-ACP synthase III [Flavobacteriaceae bacterium]